MCIIRRALFQLMALSLWDMNRGVPFDWRTKLEKVKSLRIVFKTLDSVIADNYLRQQHRDVAKST